MKNFFLGVAATLLLCITLAATPVGENLLTVKPATPKYTTCYYGNNPTEWVKKQAEQGYVVVSSASGSGSGFYTFVIMAKY